jgi:hypothetical protein
MNFSSEMLEAVVGSQGVFTAAFFNVAKCDDELAFRFR